MQNPQQAIQSKILFNFREENSNPRSQSGIELQSNQNPNFQNREEETTQSNNPGEEQQRIQQAQQSQEYQDLEENYQERKDSLKEE